MIKTNKEKPQIEHYSEKILGLEIEKEDRDVGIFGNDFVLGIETEKNKVWISMGDDNFISLLELLKPHYEEMKAEEDYNNDVDNDVDNIKQNLSVVVEDLKIILNRCKDKQMFDEMQRLENCISLLHKWY
jgi:hypothetical protein